jgi:hypothetical protein
VPVHQPLSKLRQSRPDKATCWALLILLIELVLFLPEGDGLHRCIIVYRRAAFVRYVRTNSSAALEKTPGSRPVCSLAELIRLLPIRPRMAM